MKLKDWEHEGVQIYINISIGSETCTHDKAWWNVFFCNKTESNKCPHDLISLVSEIFTNTLKYHTDIIKFITNGSHIFYRMQKTGF